jgi:long-chain acyl-CoA synthetase
LSKVAHNLDEDPILGQAARAVKERMDTADRSLGRIEEMLRVYTPFIRDNDYRFATDNLRELTASLPESDRERFGYDLTDLDWCSYWVDVEYPGLMHWSIPLLHGQKAPEDPVSKPAFTLIQTPAVKVVSL